MKKLILTCTALISFAFAQEYKTGLQFKDGFTAIFFTRAGAPTNNLFKTPESTTRYGLLSKDKKIVLPMKYKAVMSTYEPGIFIVKDTLDKQGLYNALTNKFITGMDYYEIELFIGGLAVVKKEKQPYGFDWGAVDTKGNIVIPVEYDYLGPYMDGLMNFKKDDKSGFIDRSNTVVIPAMYANISNFSNGLAPVTLPGSGKYGYIDKQNKMVIPAIYEDAEDFYQGYAMVTRKKLVEAALINAQGKELTDFSYSFISIRQPGGFFLAKKGKLMGALDTTGKLVMPLEYEELNSFGDDLIKFKTTTKKFGLASAKGNMLLKPEYDYISYLHNDILYTKKDGKFSVITKKLKTVIPPDSAEKVLLGDKRIAFFGRDKAKIYDANGKLLKTFMQPNLRATGCDMIAKEDTLVLYYDAAVFLANLATNSVKPLPYNEAGDFNKEGVFIAKNDNKFYFLDQTGKQIHTKGYYAAVAFSEGIGAVQETSTGTPYLVDKNFTKIKDLSYLFKGPYSEGLALAKSTYGNTVYYLDKTGNSVFNITANDGGPCTNGLIWIKDSYGYFYFVDKTGKRLGTESWTGLREFSDGCCAVNKSGKWGFIDATGNYTIQPTYGEASSFSNGVAAVKTGDKFILINKKGEPVDNINYAAAGNPDKGFFPLMKGTKVGLVNSKGATIVDFKYDNITPPNEDRIWASKNGKWGLLDNTGKELTAFIYSSTGAFSNGYAYVALGEKVGVINKAGKLVLPAEYKTVGSVYKNMMVAMKGSGMVKYSIK